MSKRRRRPRSLVVAALSVTGLALLAPASVNAATTIGRLDPDTLNTGCEPGNIYLQTDINAVSFPGLTYSVPAAGGVITSWSTRANDEGGQQASLKIVRNNGNNTVTVLASSALRSLSPGVNNVPARIPVSGGDSIGYGAGGVTQACFDSNVNANSRVIAGPDPSPANVFTVDSDSGQRLMNLTATVEADADRDGFGDETQDNCRGASGTNGGCPTGSSPGGPGGGGGAGTDRTKPRLGSLSFSRGTFAAAKSGGAFSSQKGRKKKKTPVGTKVSFNLSEASSVRFTVQRKTTGRRSSGKCRTRTRKNRKKPRCTLYKNVSGSFTFRGKTGNYRLNGTATDPARNASVPTNKTFKIVK